MLRKFLGDVLPSFGPWDDHAGHYCVTLLPEGRHLWTDNLDSLAELCEQFEDRKGVYFGTAAFASDESRTQANVLSLKALRLDIDAGAKKHERDPDGTYPDQRTALAAVVAFCKSSRLAPSYIISSGEGLHVYYCLDTALPPGEWRVLAVALGAAAATAGLRVDPSVTTDSARILRPVGGLHSEGKRVSVLRDTGAVYTLDQLRDILPESAPVRKFDTSINADLDLGFQGPPSSALKVAENCAALREVAAARGDVQEPLWRAMLGLVKRTVEGLDIAHEWSRGYDGYDPDEVERKFHAWTAGPTTCTEFSRHTKACSGCKFAGKVKSPINLGLMTTPEIEELPEEVRQEVVAAPVEAPPTGDPWDGQIPPGFTVIRGKFTGAPTLVYELSVEKESETGELVPVTVQVPFTHDIFWFGPCAGAEHSDDTAVVTLCVWNGRAVRQFLMDQSLVASQSKLLEYMSGKAIQTTTHKRAAQAMQDYTKAGLHRVKTLNSRPKIADHLGMRILDDGQLVAAHGAHVIFPDGSIKEAFVGANLRTVAGQFQINLPPKASGEWGPEVWDEINPKAQQHVDFLRKHYGREGMERFQLAILMGLASPLMAFVTGSFFSGSTLPRMSSLSVSLFSRESARGKTTAVQSAILAYGKASDLTNDSGKSGTTEIARIARLSLHGTMPNLMDEMGGASAASVAATVSAVANGTGRERATREGSLQSTVPWALVNLITTNTSQRDMIASIQDTSGAIQYRLLEINVEDMPEYDQAARDTFTEDWALLNRDCAGALGAVIHREICAVGVVGITKLVTDCCAKASALLKSDQTARFQYRGLGAMLALHLLLSKIGMAPFALQGVVAAFRTAHDAGRDFVVENVLPTDGLQLLSRALQDLAPHTLITEEETQHGRIKTKFDEPLNARVPEIIKARHVKQTGVTYLAVDALRDWCREKGVVERDIIREARKAGVLRPRSAGSAELSSGMYNLTKGLRANTQLYCKCYTFSIKQLYCSEVDESGNVVMLRGREPLEHPTEETLAS